MNKANLVLWMWAKSVPLLCSVVRPANYVHVPVLIQLASIKCSHVIIVLRAKL